MNGDEEGPGFSSRNEIVIQYIPLIQKVVSRFRRRIPPSVDSDDLFNAGVLGLIDAVERFEPRNTLFKHYAEIRIRGAILDELRNMDEFSRSLRQKANTLSQAAQRLEGRLGRPPTSEELAQSLSISLENLRKMQRQIQPVVYVSNEPPQSNNQQGQDWGILLASILEQNLADPFKEAWNRQVQLLLEKAINSLPERQRLVISFYYFEEMTLREIGTLLALSESRISQIHSAARQALKERLFRSYPELENAG